jgi:hypothetical protein
MLDALNYRVLLIGDFSVHGFDWNYGLHSSNCQYYTRLEADMICLPAISFVGLNQRDYHDSGSSLLDLVFLLRVVLATRFTLLKTMQHNLIVFIYFRLSLTALCELDVLN